MRHDSQFVATVMVTTEDDVLVPSVSVTIVTCAHIADCPHHCSTAALQSLQHQLQMSDCMESE